MHEVTFLGHKCTDKGILPDDKKYDVIKNYLVPHGADSARRFVADVVLKTLPTILVTCYKLCKNVKFEWTADCQHANNIITDSSKQACGAV